jgi:hypothetical protein
VEVVHCPLCGKSNPVENKFCDFCLGHLKPGEQTPADISEQPLSGTEDNRHGLGGRENDAELPEWLKEIQQEEANESPQPGEPISDMGLTAESGADRLTEPPGEEVTDSFASDYLSQESDSEAKPFLSDQELPSSEDNPDWLNDALTEKVPEDIGGDELFADSQSEIPLGELEEDESKSTKTGREPRGVLEGAGPLAGLKGVLSAEPGAAQIRKSGAYSTKLRVTENQRNHVELLESMIADEGQPLPLPRRTPISQQNVFRWAIALIMLVVILWPIILDSRQMPLPMPDEGSAEVSRLITQLPEDAKVLLGLDYEPGLTEELEAVAAPVIDHLIVKGSLLTLVSTSPSGVILAERLIETMQGEEELISGSDYVNLGYIPGGAAGIRSFSENPEGTLPASVDDSPVWGSDTNSVAFPLEGIDQITDYDMVVLLADDPDVARAWIEQLGSIISNPDVLTSFVLVTSAQLEPVVQPYFSSSPQLVNGMVTGLRGGAIYSRLTGGDNITNQYWDAFGMGAFTAAMLILVGGLGYYVLPELARLGEPEGKGGR